MGEVFGRTIAAARRQRGITQQVIANTFGISRPAVGQWESGATDPEPEKLPELGKLLGIDIMAAMAGELVFRDGESAPPKDQALQTPEPAPNARVLRADEAPPFPGVIGGARDVPVLGTAIGGDDGDFHFNGQTIDHLPRMPGIANRQGVYGIEVVNDSMYPRFRPGARLYVDPHRTPAIGDDVIVELHSAVEGEPGRAFIKALVRRTARKIVVEQFNPPKEIEFEAAEVRRLHRVIPWDELAGI